MRTHLALVLASSFGTVIGALSAAGCTQPAAPASDPNSATISIPLTQAGANGALYHLTASFEISAPDGTVQTVDAGSADSAVTVNVAIGKHTVRVADGWALERSVDGGATFTPVPAFLAGDNPRDVVVVPGRTVTLGLQFIVRETTGNLAISFGVIDPPRNLVASVQITSATDAYTAYVGSSVDFIIYFTPGTQTTNYYYEGYSPYYYTYYRVYTTTVNGIEFLNDGPGALAPLAHSLDGGTLSFTLTNRSFGTQQFSGDYAGATGTGADILFGTSTSASFSAVGTFPDDAAFTASGSAIQMTIDGNAALSGTLISISEYL